MLKRVAAIILDDKKVLMVTGSEADFYWTPGGMVDEGESLEDALARELDEELSVKPLSINKYFIYNSYKLETNEPMEVNCYMVEYKGTLTPSNEVSCYMWYTKDHFEKKSPRLFHKIEEILVPKLIEDDLL